jgi:hypothetical protein
MAAGIGNGSSCSTTSSSIPGQMPSTSPPEIPLEIADTDLRNPRVIGRRPGLRTLTPGAVNRIDLLRHMLNWPVGREYLQRTPFRRGTETLIKKLHDDSRRRRRVSEDEEAALLEAASPQIQAMLIAAIDTGMRRGEMLALQFGDVDVDRGLIVLRGETTKSKKTRIVPTAVRSAGGRDAGSDRSTDQGRVETHEIAGSRQTLTSRSRAQSVKFLSRSAGWRSF